ncbi:hypothetical protein [Paraburkholderia guartelaensis]|uniref:Uncharacterized protein n=1 Tax=Paraburkholderia guartelaensis TaxID=2546446 RepID=A0ABU9SJK5_9BURK
MSDGIRPQSLRLYLLDHDGTASLARRTIASSREFGDVVQHLSDRDVLTAYRSMTVRLADGAEYVRALGTAVVEGAKHGAPGTRLAVELSNGMIIVVPDNHKPH